MTEPKLPESITRSIDELEQDVFDSVGPDDWAEARAALEAAILAAIDAKQASIDALMLEHCPEEMTKEQVDEWEKHQRPTPPDTLAAIIAEMYHSAAERDGGAGCGIANELRSYADRLAAIAPGEPCVWITQDDFKVLQRGEDTEGPMWAEDPFLWHAVPEYEVPCVPLYAAPPPAARSTEPCAWRYVGYACWFDMKEHPPHRRVNIDKPIEVSYLHAPPAPKGEGLVQFARELIQGAFEGGSFDGGDIQDIALKHGLLKEVTATEQCGESCRCVEYDDFPQTCYRMTDLLRAPPEPARQEKGE